MTTRESRIEEGGWQARSLVECGSSLPLSIAGTFGQETGENPKGVSPQGWRTQALWDWWRMRVGFATLSAVLILSSVSAYAQGYAIDWFKIAAGGGTSTGGVYSISGTIGQSDANPQPLTGGSFSLVGGFWALLAVQTPGAPLLTIRLTSTNTAVILWPSSSGGFTLQEMNDLDTANWTAAPETVFDDGTNKFIIANPPTGNRFYRLLRP